MTDKTHAQKAQHYIDGVHQWQEREGDTDATNLASAQLAVAEAQLAVAEQLRIANLITLSRILSDANDWLYNRFDTAIDTEGLGLRPEIAKILEL